MYAKLGFYVNIVFKMTSLAATIYCVPAKECMRARSMKNRKRTDEKKKQTERVLNYNLNATDWKSTMDHHLNKHIKWFFIDANQQKAPKKTPNKSAICVTNDCNAYGHLPSMVFHILPFTLIKWFCWRRGKRFIAFHCFTKKNWLSAWKFSMCMHRTNTTHRILNTYSSAQHISHFFARILLLLQFSVSKWYDLC